MCLSVLKKDIFFSLMICIGIMGVGSNVLANPQAQGVPARVSLPETRPIFKWQEYTGRFEASKRVDVSSRVSGYLVEIRFEDGQEVNQGDVLFVIDQRPYELALSKAQAQFDYALKNYNRALALQEPEAISKEDFDTAYYQLGVAKADLESAKLDLEFTEIKAPFSGRIGKSYVDEGNLIIGDYVSPTVLATVLVVSPVYFYFDWSEKDILAYKRRQSGESNGSLRDELNWPVYVKLLDEDQFAHEGKLDFISNEMSERTGTAQARAVFHNEKAFLEAGLFGRLRMATTKNANQAILIPEHAVLTEQTLKFVYVLGEGNKASKKYVTLGDVTDDGMQIILNGITPEDNVIVGSLHMIRPGAPISPIQNKIKA